jgi:hypothetical protein
VALAEGRRFDERAVEGEMDSPPVPFAVGSELGDSYVAAKPSATAVLAFIPGRCEAVATGRGRRGAGGSASLVRGV